MATGTTAPSNTPGGGQVPGFQRLLESIPFLILVGLIMPTVVYTAWSVAEIVRLPSFDEAALHGTAGHAATSAAATSSPSATTAAAGATTQADTAATTGQGIVASGPAAGTSVASGAVRVALRNMAFSQKELEIEQGTTVTWVNEDPFAHAVAYGTPDVPVADKLFYSGDFDSDWSYSLTFDEPGTYQIYCSTPGHFAAGMTMTVTVKGR